MTKSRTPIFFAALAFLVTAPLIAQADVINFYTGATGDLASDLAVFDAVQDFGDGVNSYGVFNIDAADSPFGDGNAVRLVDLYDGDKPEIQGEFAEPIFEPFRIDFQSFDQSPASSSSAIRFRMANSGQSISSEGRSAFSLSWQADGKVSAKYQGNADDNPSDVDTTSSDALVGVQDITMVANGALSGDYTYSLFGIERTLNPLSYDVYINGELLNSSMEGDDKHEEFMNGMAFHTLRSTDYDPALGIQRFGLIGSSNSNTDPDVLYDNITFFTGADIAPVPEPGSSLLLLVGSSVWMLGRRRRQQ